MIAHSDRKNSAINKNSAKNMNSHPFVDFSLLFSAIIHDGGECKVRIVVNKGALS